MIKKKGDIVPKYLLRGSRGGQHLARFGCDVEIVGKRVTALTEGNIIEIPRSSYKKRKNRNKSKRNVTFTCGGIQFFGYKKPITLKNQTNTVYVEI